MMEEQKSIFETILEGMERDIPKAEWSRLPTDGAEEHDHYLYGSPKKSDAELQTELKQAA